MQVLAFALLLGALVSTASAAGALEHDSARALRTVAQFEPRVLGITDNGTMRPTTVKPSKRP